MIKCLEWRDCERGTLQGFAKLEITKWKLLIDGVAIHTKKGRSWASLPSRPQIGSDKRQIIGADGKAAYSRFLSFTSREVADQFSDAAVAAVDLMRRQPSMQVTADDPRTMSTAQAIKDEIVFAPEWRA